MNWLPHLATKLPATSSSSDRSQLQPRHSGGDGSAWRSRSTVICEICRGCRGWTTMGRSENWIKLVILPPIYHQFTTNLHHFTTNLPPIYHQFVDIHGCFGGYSCCLHICSEKKEKKCHGKIHTIFSGKESSAYEQSVFLENSPSICNCFLLVPGLFTGGPLGWPTKRSWALLTTLHRSHTGENCAPFCRAITMAGVHNPKN